MTEEERFRATDRFEKELRRMDAERLKNSISESTGFWLFSWLWPGSVRFIFFVNGSWNDGPANQVFIVFRGAPSVATLAMRPGPRVHLLSFRV